MVIDNVTTTWYTCSWFERAFRGVCRGGVMCQTFFWWRIFASPFRYPRSENVSFRLRHGEVHVLLGENGAGKSTLIKILSGAYTLDSGKIFLEGREIDMTNYNPQIASRMGIATIYQNFHLVPHLTVAENISLATFPVSRMGFINWPKVRAFAEQALQKVQLQVDPNTKVKILPCHNSKCWKLL